MNDRREPEESWHMSEADHFAVWAVELSLEPAWKAAWRSHDGYARALAAGDHEASRWQFRAAYAMRLEAEGLADD